MIPIVTIPKAILDGIFDECDKYDTVETGGRLIGFYRIVDRGHGPVFLHIQVKATLHAGPKARRTAASFFNDGDYQESLFRAVEQQYPDIQHLGNWHTHHPNGLESLSNGDYQTYMKVVNSEHHDTDFFYSLLVTRRLLNDARRYLVKHYIVYRGDRQIHRLDPSTSVEIADVPILKL